MAFADLSELVGVGSLESKEPDVCDGKVGFGRDFIHLDM